jgi:mannose-6-phosphate isomerase-like protein (cupin superfamily)
VTIDDAQGHSLALADGPCTDTVIDPSRPGYRSTRIWMADCTPAAIPVASDSGPPAIATLERWRGTAQRLEPPSGGSQCRIVTIPPDQAWRGKVSTREVQAHFASIGSPTASQCTSANDHPYTQRTQTLDLCLVLEGEVTLILDVEEVHLSAGDTVVQRATRHAWSNRSNVPCVMAITSHTAHSNA